MNGNSESALILVGWDFHSTPLSLRERLAFSPDEAREALSRMLTERLLTEGVIVSTCNRSEVYGVAGLAPGEDSAEALTQFIADFRRLPKPEIDATRYRSSGATAVQHLFRVAAGLESLALGEDQILGQVREAFRLASGAGATRSVLHRLFQKAFEAGKRVRTETELGSRPTSIPGVALELAQKIYEDIDQHSFLIIGAGENASIFHDLLVSRGIRSVEIVNRTFERAEALARHGGAARRWEDLNARLPFADIVVCATSSAEPVVGVSAVREALAFRRGQPMFILDLSVPRNVEGRVAELDNAFLYGVDDLQTIAERNRREREKDVPVAERILEEEVQDFLAWYGALAVVPTLTALREKFEKIREEEFDRLLERMPNLPEGDRERVRQLARSLVRSLLRGPTEALKEEADAARRIDRAEAVRHLFGLDEKPER
jgi:glutamyl-tRNA reductase